MLKDLKQNLRDGKMLKQVQHDTGVKVHSNPKSTHSGEELKQVQDDVKVGFGRTLAFTLAEVLIVIGIIGVVAALTLPNLNHATGDKETVTKVKKIYSSLTEAFDRAQVIYGDYDTWFKDIDTNDYSQRSKRFANRVSEFLKISKYCIDDTTSGCMTSGIMKQLNNSNCYYGSLSHYPSILTSDGTTILFLGVYNSSEIYIDVNGPKKGPFTWGKDVFSFRIDNNQLIPKGNDQTFSQLVSTVNMSSSGERATAWIINYDNMDYLKITDANGTCNNGNVVTESNPSCN